VNVVYEKSKVIWPNLKAVFIFLILTLFSTVSLSALPVYVQWREIDPKNVRVENDMTYIQLKEVAGKFGKVIDVENEALVIIKHDKWKVFLFPKSGMCVINNLESFSIQETDARFYDGSVFLSPQLLAKILDLELIVSSKGIYFNRTLSKVQSIKTIIQKSLVRTIIELSEDAESEISPLVNTYGYLIKIFGAAVPETVYYEEFNDKIKYIKAYHYSETEVWVKIVLNCKAQVNKIIEDKRIVLDFAFEEVDRPVVVIDAGHGGYDPGTVGFSKLYEKDVALAVAKKTRELLKEYSVDVKLIREDDTYIDLHKRAVMSNDFEADLFISVHLNSFPDDRSVRGSEVYYFDFSKTDYARKIAWRENLDQKKDKQLIETWVHDKENSISASKKFGEVLESTLKLKGIKSRGVSPAEFAVLAYTRSPAVLFELEFLSNSVVEENFKNLKYTKLFAEIIADSVIKYFDLKK
jgi:N-acetylmuramoyl-L-alanine amidase